MCSVMVPHWVAQTSDPIFAICRQKFTTLIMDVQEILACNTISVWQRILVFRRHSQSSCEFAEVFMFSGSQIFGKGTQIL